MCASAKITVDILQRTCLPSDIPFETTASAPTIAGPLVGQDRAVEALNFGIGIDRHGYNMIAIGPHGLGKETLMRKILGERAAREMTPSDWCYVHNFRDPARPRALALPAGTGLKLQRDMQQVVAELSVEMRAVFESDEYQTRKHQLADQLKKRQNAAMAEIQERAKEHHIAIVQTDSGCGVAPIHGNEVIDADRFRTLDAQEQKVLRANLDHFSSELQSLFRRFNEWRREEHEQLRACQREMAAIVARRVIDGVRARYPGIAQLEDYFSQIELDVVESLDDFLESSAQGVEAALRQALKHEPGDGASFRRYQVNVLVDRSQQQGAPVIYEDHPTYANLTGRIEHETAFGSLVTNFLLIRPGALHRANGGYLIVDVLKVLQQIFAWEAVKRTVRSGQIRIESLSQAIGLVPTVSLEPEPIPLGKTKIVLISDRVLYYLLATLDPDFVELFKVLVDFEEVMDRREDAHATYANLVASIVRHEQLFDFDRGAVARIIDHAARVAGDTEKLSVRMRMLADIMREAHYWCRSSGRQLVCREDVDQAIDAKIARAGRLRDRLLEAVHRGDILIATSGEVVGQINGLSVFQLGEDTFGHPTRITARTRVGKGEVIDIEREVALGGPIHSKGVLILSGYLGARYSANAPLSLSATLVFEQSYGAVEGDSASLAELCALLSSLGNVELTQSLAVTGSINQQGGIQSVGGINEKIEGFFDVCRGQGLRGDQGVIIPRTNIKNLTLRRDVMEAIAAGRFHIYAVDNVDDAMELLTGRVAGGRDDNGRFPSDSINARIEERLERFAESVRVFMAKSSSDPEVLREVNDRNPQ